MSPTEAHVFFQDHSKWLADSWGRSPEGRAYKERFDDAVRAVAPYALLPESTVSSWANEVTKILNRPDNIALSPYVEAIKFTRHVLGLSLKEAKDKVDYLRATF